MGVDLGLKHFAVLSIFEYNRLTGKKYEIGRHFLDQRRVLGCTFDSSMRHFSSSYRNDYNLKRKLDHLRQQQRAHGSIWNQMETDGGHKRTIQYFYMKKRHTRIWQKIQKIHTTLTQQIAHVISLIANAYKVSWIYFEDLRWSQHSSRNKVGRWLSQNQMHFFHSKIIKAVELIAEISPFKVKIVNARWTSQICWTTQLKFNLNITYQTNRASIAPYLGTRTQKQFIYTSRAPELSWQGDSDLNAARNLVLRGLLVS